MPMTTDLGPHIGDIVEYLAGTADDSTNRPAIITEVHADTPDTMSPVDMTVFTPTGDLRPQNVAYDGSENPAPGTWHRRGPTTLDE